MKFYKVLIPIIGIAIFLIIDHYNSSTFYKRMYQSDLDKEYYGTITDKRIETNNHSARIIFLNGKERVSINSEFYTKVDIGDSIAKIKGDFIISLFKKDGHKLEFSYNAQHKEINPNGYKSYIKTQ